MGHLPIHHYVMVAEHHEVGLGECGHVLLHLVGVGFDVGDAVAAAAAGTCS